jgi:hypothetical protein
MEYSINKGKCRVNTPHWGALRLNAFPTRHRKMKRPIKTMVNVTINSQPILTLRCALVEKKAPEASRAKPAGEPEDPTLYNMGIV